MNYIFTSNLLSAVGSPPSLVASLSSSQRTVVIDTLSAYVGLAYSHVATTPATSALVAVTVQGNSLRISASHHNQAFALIKANRQATIFTFLSGGGAIVPSATTLNYTTPELRRLSVLGYI